MIVSRTRADTRIILFVSRTSIFFIHEKNPGDNVQYEYHLPTGSNVKKNC